LAPLLALLLLIPLLLGGVPPAAALGGAPVGSGADGVVTPPLRVRLLEDPRSLAEAAAPAAAKAAPCRALAETDAGRAELLLEGCADLRQGWRLEVRGRWLPLPAAPHPLLAGPAERLARQGVRQRLRVAQLIVLARPPTPIADLRRAIAGRFVATAGAERGGILAALVLGSAVVPLPAELREAFRASGLSHALAASGFHLTVLLGAVRRLAAGLGSGARLGLGGGAMVLFLLLAGAQPSVVRAVLTGGVGWLALEAGRRTRPLAVLALAAALMLALRPDWLWDVGFQLSVAATAGLLVSAEPIEAWLGPRLPAALRPDWSAPAIAVPLAATIWTLPLQLAHFGVVPLYAVPANLAAAPLLTPLTLGAMGLTLPALLLPPLAAPLLWPLQALTGLLVAIARVFAALPLAQWQIGRPQPLLVALLSLALLALVLPGRAAPWRRAGLLLLAAVAALQFASLRADRLLLVHQAGGGGGRDWLIARHDGRAALIATRADPLSCRQSQRLATGLGIARFDWLLLLDSVAPADPGCWRRQGGYVLAYGEAAAPLAAGQSLSSPGLAVTALSMDSHALSLRFGSRHWQLLPDRQALWAWRDRESPPADGLWLGFLPWGSERRALAGAPQSVGRVWLSGAAPGSRRLPPGWRASGASGFLADG
jgi:competence protein ComEC